MRNDHDEFLRLVKQFESKNPHIRVTCFKLFDLKWGTSIETKNLVDAQTRYKIKKFRAEQARLEGLDQK